MIVLNMLERSYVDDVTDHKGRVNGLKMLLSPRSVVQTQVFSGAERMFNQEEKRRAGKRRAAAPPTVNGDDFNGEYMGMISVHTKARQQRCGANSQERTNAPS